MSYSNYAGAFRFDTDKVFRFKRPFSSANQIRARQQSTNRAISGKVETLNYYDIDRIPLQRDWIDGTEFSGLRRWYESVRDGSSFEFWHDYKLVNYFSFDNDSVDASDGLYVSTFARTGAALYESADTGLLESAATGIPRFVAGPTDGDRAVLIEKSASNFLTYSEQFDHANWTKSNLTVVANKYISPDGTLNADILDGSTGATDGYIEQSITASVTADYTFSVWARSPGEDLSFSLTCPEKSDTETVTLTKEWQRVELKTSGISTDTITFRIPVVWDESFFPVVFGAQVEVGPHATGYIKTEAATASRGAESLYVEPNDYFKCEEWSFSSWVYFDYNDDGDDIIFFSAESSSTDVLVIQKSTDDDYLDVVTTDLNGYLTKGVSTYSVTNISTSGWHYLSFIFTKNGLIVYIDGIQQTSTLTSSTWTIYARMTKPEEIYLGGNSANNKSSVAFHGTIIEDRIIDLAEHSARYNRNYSLSDKKNYFPAVRLTEPTHNPIQVLGGQRWNFETEIEEAL